MWAARWTNPGSDPSTRTVDERDSFRMSPAMRFFLVALPALCLVACASQTERQAGQEKKARLVDTYIQLGISYMQRGQLDTAKENLDKALEVSPDSPQANNVMALLQWRLKQH